MVSMKMWWVLAPTLIIAVTTRLLWLDTLPQGAHEDEIAFTYNAYSLATTGRDEWGITPWQAAFSLSDPNLYSFGASKMLLYSYALIPVVGLFGLDHITARYFSAIVGILTGLVLYFLGKFLVRDSQLPLRGFVPAIATLLFLANPLHITLSRRAIDPAFSLLVMTLTVLLYLHGFYRKRLISVILVTLLLIIQVTTYYPTKFFLFLYLPVILGTYYWHHKKTPILLLIPTILFLLIFSTYQLGHDNAKVSENSALGSYQLQGVLSDLNERLGACRQELPEFTCKLFYNRPLAYTILLIKNYVAHFSSSFLFTHGVNVFDTSFIKDRGILYLFEVPLIIAGLLQLPKLSIFPRTLVLFWLLIFPIPDSLLGPGTPRRMLTGLPILSLFGALGSVTLFALLRKQVRHVHKAVPAALLIAFVAASTTKFMLDYHWYSFKAGKYFRTAEEHAFRKLVAMESQFQHVYVTESIPLAYLYYTYYKKIPPRDFQAIARRVSVADAAGEWIKVGQVGTVLFEQTRQSLPENLPPQTLILATPNDTWVPAQYPSLIKLKQFADTNGEIEQELWGN